VISKSSSRVVERHRERVIDQARPSNQPGQSKGSYHGVKLHIHSCSRSQTPSQSQFSPVSNPRSPASNPSPPALAGPPRKPYVGIVHLKQQLTKIVYMRLCNMTLQQNGQTSWMRKRENRSWSLRKAIMNGKYICVQDIGYGYRLGLSPNPSAA
jgi:hypothetical protein